MDQPPRHLVCRLFSLTAWILLAMACFACQNETARPGPAIARYPDSVLERLDGRQPFVPNDATVAHDITLKPLMNEREGIYGLTVGMQLEGLGSKSLLLDTAGRGLLLKAKLKQREEVIRAPEWLQSGPGLQTGVFRILPCLSHKNLRLTPVVAELFWGRGFQWIDGILATEVFRAWVVRLNFRQRKLFLLPRQSYSGLPQQEWPARLERNWWLVEVRIEGNPACLLLDSGSGRTRLAERWLRAFLPERIPFSGRAAKTSALPASFEAGECKFEIRGLAPFRKPILGIPDVEVPHLPGIPCDGLLGIDALKELAVDMDYQSGRLFLLSKPSIP